MSEAKNDGPRAGATATGGGALGTEAIVPALDNEAEAIFKQGFKAMEHKWNNQKQKWQKFPDLKTRLDYLKLYLSYRHGLPLVRQIRLQGSFKDNDAMLAEIAATPSGKRMLLQMGAIDENWLEKRGQIEAKAA